MMVANVRERLSVNSRIAQNFEVERSNNKKLRGVEIKE
jgi:hypothetical protein